MVEFKDEEFVKKAIETMNKHDLSGRPLNIKEVRTNILTHCKKIVDLFCILSFTHSYVCCLLTLEI